MFYFEILIVYLQFKIYLSIMNMKTFYTILSVMISFFPVLLQAKQVSPETAMQVAEMQVLSRNQLRNGQAPVLKLIHTETIDNKTINTGLKSSEINSTYVIYYVYNIEGNGLVIVSGDDIAVPILGYSDSGTYDPNNLSPNFVYYMNCLAWEIKEAIANDIPQSVETKEQWDAFLTGNSLKTVSSSTPLLDVEGIKWGQTAPYNGMCPTLTVNNVQTKTVAGCVATAMAQIMRYYKYPNQGKGTVASYISYNIDSTATITIPSKDLSKSLYNWNVMTPTYPNAVYDGNDPAQSAVALLMYDCGISAKMQFDIPDNGSGASDWDAGNALLNNFSYGKGLTYKQRIFYSNTEWETLLKAEIDAGRPVFYAGADTLKSIGHAFVCDGYEGNNFHFNWGWNGSQNGFFPTTALNPNVFEKYQFNDNQEILAGISPNNSGINNYEIVLDAGATSPMTFTSSKSQVDLTDQFNVSAQYYFNIGFTPLKGYPGLALYNQTNQLVQILAAATSDRKKAAYDLEPMGYGWGIGWTGITLPTSVLPGNYFIKPIVIDSVSENTIPVRLYSTTSLPLTVKGIILDSTSLKLSVGKQEQIKPTVFMSPVPGVTWTSNNTNIATVDANGLVKGISIGSATITASVTSGTATYKAICAVTVINDGTGLGVINSVLKTNVYEADGFVRIMSDASDIIKEIEIYNLQGVLIYKDASINAISYTVIRKLPTGAYIVKVISENNIDNVKLILH